jgi:hypothetical protein
MDVRNFSIARDLLYLSGALTGIALGYILTLFRKNMTIRSRNRRITLIFFVFSGVLTAFSAAIVSSYGDIFHAGGLFIAAGIGIPVFALAVCFPRAAAYPLILAGGLSVVWMGYSFLRFPLTKESSVPLAYIHHQGNNVYSIGFPPQPGKTGGGQTGGKNGDRAVSPLQINGHEPSLEFQGFFVGFDPRYPLIGGTERGAITIIRENNEIVYTEPSLEKSILKTYYPWVISQSRFGSFGINFHHVQGAVSADAIPRGANLAVYIDGGALSFQPSR